MYIDASPLTLEVMLSFRVGMHERLGKCVNMFCVHESVSPSRVDVKSKHSFRLCKRENDTGG